jgi:hypothetical protein
LRAFGQYTQYQNHSPPDITTWNTGGWTSTLPTTVAGYPISNIQVVCGDATLVCSASNHGWPRYYSYTTTVTLSPMVLGPVLCTSPNANRCSYTLLYSERFQ